MCERPGLDAHRPLTLERRDVHASIDVDPASGEILSEVTACSEQETNNDQPDVRASKYHKSRIFGQTHRNNERALEQRLESEIMALQRERAMLSSLLAHNAIFMDHRASPDSSLSSFSSPSVSQYRLAPKTAAVLGTDAISGTIAATLLEIVSLRRNVIPPVCDSRTPRRRRSGLVAPPQSMYEALFKWARQAFANEFLGSEEDRVLYVEQQFRILTNLHSKWAQQERDFGPLSMFPNNEYQGLSDLTSGPAQEYPARTRRRKGCGPRRCTRCKKIKHAGSGHGRSNCDDGVSVSRSIPYPAGPNYGRTASEQQADSRPQ